MYPLRNDRRFVLRRRVVVFGGQLDGLVQVARARGGHDGVDDAGAAAALAESLVRADELRQLLEPL